MASSASFSDNQIPASLMQDFWKAVQEGLVTRENFSAYLDGLRYPPSQLVDHGQSYVDLKTAIEILGAKNVVTVHQAYIAWGISSFGSPNDVPYSEAQLRRVADSNRKGETQFHLVYVTGQSLRTMVEKSGITFIRVPEDGSTVFRDKDKLDPNSINDPDLQSSEGYYLVDLAPKQISLEGYSRYSTGNEVVIPRDEVHVEAILSVFKVHDKNTGNNLFHQGSKYFTDNSDKTLLYRFVQKTHFLISSVGESRRNHAKDIGTCTTITQNRF